MNFLLLKQFIILFLSFSIQAFVGIYSTMLPLEIHLSFGHSVSKENKGKRAAEEEVKFEDQWRRFP